jgi:glycolate oxidase
MTNEGDCEEPDHCHRFDLAGYLTKHDCSKKTREIPMERADLLRELEKIVGPDFVRHRPVDLMVYEYDGSVEGAVELAAPTAVVLPASTDEVMRIVKLAFAAGIPVTARGAGTGLSGGAVAQAGGIIVALTRMDRILDVDPIDRSALVQPGVINLELSEAVADHGLFFAPDPSSQKACTIGGNVAENSGGPHCLKYGVTTNHILGLEVVLPTGEVIWTDVARDGFAGLDLTAAVVGSEGMFGIVTKALVRLTQKQPATRVMLAAFDSMESASSAVTNIIAAGNLPAALEMVDNLTIQAVEPVYHAGYPMDAQGVLLIEVDGHPLDVEETSRDVEGICRSAGATTYRQADSQVERDLLWKGRKMALAAMGRLAPNYYLHDTVVPRTRLAETLVAVEHISAEYKLPIANVFHAGDGNLHPLMLFDRRVPGDTEKVLEASHHLIETCVSLGGALSGEHGIGTEKRGYMTLVFSDDDLRAMAGLKGAFDPEQRFNPGKVFPKGYTCSDIQALHLETMVRKHDIVPV